jgi:hypothetical protein
MQCLLLHTPLERGSASLTDKLLFWVSAPAHKLMPFHCDVLLSQGGGWQDLQMSDASMHARDRGQVYAPQKISWVLPSHCLSGCVRLSE